MSEPNEMMKRHLLAAIAERHGPERADRLLWASLKLAPKGGFTKETLWRALELATQEPDPEPITPVGWDRVDEIVGTLEEIIERLREMREPTNET